MDAVERRHPDDNARHLRQVPDPIRAVQLELRRWIEVLRFPAVRPIVVCRPEPEQPGQLFQLDEETGALVQLLQHELQTLLPKPTGIHPQLPDELDGERQLQALRLVLDPPPDLPAEVGQEMFPTYAELDQLLESGFNRQSLAPCLRNKLLHGALHLHLGVEGQKSALRLRVEEKGKPAVREHMRLLLRVPLSIVLLQIIALGHGGVVEAPLRQNAFHLPVQVPERAQHEHSRRGVVAVLAGLGEDEGDELLNDVDHTAEVLARQPLQPTEEQPL
mmetsp:Transcript_50288/g.144975  ORF Transcript_50288/g.144975 Transcript_50288/m.144975 type:complete len:275 (-) Transcript_50288:558-1382(-)